MKFTIIYTEPTTKTISTEQFTNYDECEKRIYGLIGYINPKDISVLNENKKDVTSYFIEIKEE